MINWNPAGTGDSGRRRDIARRWFLAGVGLLAAYAVLVVNWYPIIAPDSLHYLDHSRDLTGYGFVQLGFRQVGYPLWIAAVSGTAQAIGLEPLSGIVVAQRLLLVGSVFATALALRWWSIPTAVVVLLPTTVAYSNLILTESIALPIAVSTAASCVALHRHLTPTAHRIWLVAAILGGITLPLLRLHYGLLSVAVVAAILAVRSDGNPSLRRTRLIAVAIIALSGIALFAALSVENHRDQGVFAPSLGSERVRFWMSWYTVLTGHEQEFRTQSPDIFLDGNPDTFILQTDGSSMTFPQKRATYADAIDRMFRAANANKVVERTKSMVGVLRGSRIDDLRDALAYASTPSAGETPAVIHQYGSVAEIDPAWIAHEYNAGREADAVLVVARYLPTATLPDLTSVMAAIVPYMVALAVFLLAYDRSRQLAGVALFVLMSYAFASFVYTFDNLKYVLPAYLFAMVMISGAAMARWGSRASEPVGPSVPDA